MSKSGEWYREPSGTYMDITASDLINFFLLSNQLSVVGLCLARQLVQESRGLCRTVSHRISRMSFPGLCPRFTVRQISNLKITSGGKPAIVPKNLGRPRFSA